MATQFSVSVPAGTKSASGGTLNNAKTWTFTTPAPTVKTTYPDANTPQRLDTLMFVELDQRIDPAAVLQTIKVTARKTQLPLRLATNQELEANQGVKELIKNAEKDRWLAFRAIDNLPGDSDVKVTIGPGTPSMEGSRTTNDGQEFSFSTFGPLKVTKSECGYNNQCNPNDQWRIEFNNPINETAFQQSQALIQPAMEGLNSTIAGHGLFIYGSMEAAVTRDLKRLEGMQNEDGGFGFWQRGNESWPYLSIHVAHALARAKQEKFEVPKATLDKSQEYLRKIESNIPSYYSVEARRAIVAYALYVRAQMGDRDVARARRLIAEAGLEALSPESIGWLLSVLSNDANSSNEVAAIRHLLNNRVTETAGAAHFVSSYSDSDYLLLNSNRRADGVILAALIMDQPASDLIPKIVRGLLAQRTRGRWENTQENVFILLALDRYFKTFEKVTPDFVARAWLGERFAGEQVFRGRSTDRQQVNVPMRYLSQQTAPDLVISKEGTGRLYYRVSMNYAPSDLNLKRADYGFTVERSYEAVDDPKDVTRDAEGKWHIKAGARVRVQLTMVVPTRRYHVALVDPLPAGFETLNPTLATTESIPRDPKQTGVVEYGSRSYGYGWWWWRPQWFEHQNLRDERTEAFASLLWEGVYKYSYLARATTPGDFLVPPAKAEEMYHPETFGRSSTDRVRIE